MFLALDIVVVVAVAAYNEFTAHESGKDVQGLKFKQANWRQQAGALATKRPYASALSPIAPHTPPRIRLFWPGPQQASRLASGGATSLLFLPPCASVVREIMLPRASRK